MRKLFWLMLFVAIPCLGDECDNRWSYSPPTGPENWGNIGNPPLWPICKTGIAQSPIDITSLVRDSHLLALTFGGGASTFKVKNTGKNYKVVLTNPWTLTSVQPAATLDEFHFHVPAEHLDRGRRHDAEVHFVFKHGAQAYAVGAWIDVDNSRPNAAIADILRNRPAMCRESATSAQSIAIHGLLASPGHYATYSGSLTTPPCSEPVTFLITLEPIKATQAQINGLRVLTTPMGNARPVQEIKSR